VTKPLPESSKITFTTSEAYNFMCVVHPEMRGTVTVL
jgi:plastocyanin